MPKKLFPPVSPSSARACTVFEMEQNKGQMVHTIPRPSARPVTFLGDALIWLMMQYVARKYQADSIDENFFRSPVFGWGPFSAALSSPYLYPSFFAATRHSPPPSPSLLLLLILMLHHTMHPCLPCPRCDKCFLC
ncbi:hypothetical protein CTA1_4715 [Colletotrichum tanaceti]|uniref:Uncharacterized protein n=1 Tax=Colletotrichum tanaceti TaxID=1306861 RepID=A0A4U6XW33_9PEZI|nr:hypothetical protein CTA1_4715 [Colletotrichum tanaceti]